MPGTTAATFAAFGRSEYLRSTVGSVFESYTVARNAIPADADGNKVLQSGTVLARITSASGTSVTADIGKVGPYWRGAVTNTAQTIGLGAASAGSVTITLDGVATAAIAYNATTAAIQLALEALPSVNPGDIVVTGANFPGVAILTFGGNASSQFSGVAVPSLTVTPTGLTGGTVAVVVTTVGGTAAGGSADGRQSPANIVGICDSFLPYQLNDFDREVSVLKRGRVYAASCYEYIAAEVAPGTRGISTATKNSLTIPAYNDLDLMVF